MSKAKVPPRERSLGLSPAATIAIVHTDVWRVRRLSDLLQECGARVVLLGSSGSAMQVLPGARCDVVMVGDRLERPSGAELCDALREKLGADRPFFVRLRAEGELEGERNVFDRTLAEAVEDEPLLSTLLDAIQTRRAGAAAM